MIWDKLAIINDCLLLKGQNTVAVADDGSNEWNVCSAAYEQAIEHLGEEHDWKSATAIETLTRSGDADDSDYDDAYGLPNGCLHLIWLRVDDVPETDYKIVGNVIQVDAASTTVVKAKALFRPAPTSATPMFVSALKEWVFAAIESGLKKDQATADRHLLKADGFAQRARTRSDQQEPKRSLFITRLRTARRFRRG